MKEIISNLSQQKALTFLRILYPLWMVAGMFSLMYVPSALIVVGDAATTASNIIANEFLFRASIVGVLITSLIFIFAVLLLYKLFEPVNRTYSLLMVIFALISVPIEMLNVLNRIAALFLLDKADQMMLFLNLGAEGVFIASIFWGLWLFPLSYLVYKSGYFPKIMGSLVIIGGIGFLLGSLLHFLSPNSTALLSIFDIMTNGEVIFILWLIIKGAKLPKTESQN